jgi:hypothetical protein
MRHQSHFKAIYKRGDLVLAWCTDTVRIVYGWCTDGVRSHLQAIYLGGDCDPEATAKWLGVEERQLMAGKSPGAVVGGCAFFVVPKGWAWSVWPNKRRNSWIMKTHFVRGVVFVGLMSYGRRKIW